MAEEEEFESKLVSVSEEEQYRTALLDRKKVICVSWLLPNEGTSNQCLSALQQMSGEPAMENVTFLGLNPERFPDIAQELELSALPAHQVMWREETCASIVCSNVAKVRAYLMEAISQRNAIVGDEAHWSRNSPPVAVLAKEEKANLLNKFPDMGANVYVGLGWKLAKAVEKSLSAPPPPPPSMSATLTLSVSSKHRAAEKQAAQQSTFTAKVHGFCLNDTGKINTVEDIVRESAPSAYNGTVVYKGDELKKDPEGDDIVFDINTEDFEQNVKEVMFAVSTEDAIDKFSLGALKGLYCRVYDKETGQCIAKFDATPPPAEEGEDGEEGEAEGLEIEVDEVEGGGGEEVEGAGETGPARSMLIARLYKTGSGKWKFQATGKAIRENTHGMEMLFVEKKREKKQKRAKQ